MKLAPGILFAVTLAGQVNVPTDHATTSRLGAVNEVYLTPASVAAGKLFQQRTLTLDGVVHTAVLYASSVTIGGSSRNAIFAGSAANTMYAWDADTGAVLWSTNTGDAPCTSSCTGFNWGLNYDDPVGIFSAAAIDTTNNWIFFVTINNAPIYQLYKMNLLTGAVISKVTLTASVTPSTASDAVSGTLTFGPTKNTQRAGVTLANDNVYVMFSSVRDVAPWHGWIMARKETDLSTVGDFCTNWNQNGGGIWMSNSGASVDPSGNLYVVTGNGGTDGATWTSSYNGVTEFSMSVLKFSPTLTLLDWYTPADYATQNQNDTDLGSSHPMLIPNPASAGNFLLVTGGKDYRVYSIHTECMGHLGGTVGGCPGAQVFQTGTDSGAHLGIYGDAFLNDVAYFPNTGGLLYSFPLLNTGLFNTTPTTGATTAYPGAMLAASSSGSASAILWAITANTSLITAAGSGRLRAFDASTLAEIWNNGGDFGVSKFLSPTVANGKVFVPTYDGTVLVFALRPTSAIKGPAGVKGPSAIQ